MLKARLAVRHTSLVAAILWATLHLLYIIWRTAPFPVPLGRVAASEPWTVYGAYSGTNSGYSFFAPAVASQMVVRAEWLDQSGAPQFEVRDGRSKERELRVTALFLALQQIGVTELLARALAADVLTRHPEAESITLTVALHFVPTMDEYRSGVRPADHPIYRGIFARRAELKALSGEQP